MPVVMLAVIAAMLTGIAAVVIAAAWNRVPTMRWLALVLVLVEGGAVVLAVKHVRASREDISEGVAQIRSGRATKKRTSGLGSTWHYVTLDGIGEVEVTRQQYDGMAIGTTYTVSFSPRVKRAWTVLLVSEGGQRIDA